MLEPICLCNQEAGVSGGEGDAGTDRLYVTRRSVEVVGRGILKPICFCN